jgi:hypothetical protein
MALWTPANTTTALWLSDTGSDTSVWPDLSGNARNVTQSVSASRPSIVANAINGRQVRRFDGSNDTLTNASAAILRNVTGWSVFAVATNGSDYTTDRFLCQVTTQNSLSRAVVTTVQTTGVARTGGRRLSTNSFAGADGTSAVSGNRIWSAVANHSTRTITGWIDGTQFGTNASWLTSGSTDNDGGGLYIGANLFGASLWSGDMAEIVVVESAASLSLRQQIEGYLAHKWGLAGNLPIDHPYKTNAPKYGVGGIAAAIAEII